jgi:branched-chain amino acid transport system substrate-binding protein
MAVAQKAQDRSIPMIAIATSDKIQLGRPFVFRHMLASNTSADLLVRGVAQLKLSKISTVTTIHDGMLAFKESFKEKVGFPVVDDVEVEYSETDFRKIALPMIRKKPDGIFIGLLPPQAALFAKAIRSLGYRGELFASNQIDMPSELKAGGEYFNGLWFSRDGEERNATFETEYERRYGAPPATFALNGHDVATMIIAGLQTSNLLEHLNSIKDFHGLLGTYSVLESRSFSIPGSLWVIKEGNAVPSRM